MARREYGNNGIGFPLGELLSRIFGESTHLRRSFSHGYKYYLDHAFPEGSQSHALIFSDINHRNSATQVRDLYTPERLRELQARNVTDIYVERLPINQTHADDLAAERITVEDFAAFLRQNSRNPHITEAEGVQANIDLGNAIVHASRMHPPIKFHLAQFSHTRDSHPKYQTEDNIIDLQIRATRSATLMTEAAIKFIRQERSNLTPSDVAFVKALNFSQSRLLGSQNRSIIDVDAVRQHFEGRATSLGLNQFISTISPIVAELDRMDDEYRFFNAILPHQTEDFNRNYRLYVMQDDRNLVDHIAATRTPSGNIVVEQGAAHGGWSHRDLDELLETKGLTTVSRVNVVYNESDLRNFQHERDAAEAAYYPRTDTAVIRNTKGSPQTVNGFAALDTQNLSIGTTPPTDRNKIEPSRPDALAAKRVPQKEMGLLEYFEKNVFNFSAPPIETQNDRDEFGYNVPEGP